MLNDPIIEETKFQAKVKEVVVINDQINEDLVERYLSS